MRTIFLLMLVVVWTSHAAAQETEEAAQLLYDEAKAQMDAGDYAGACPKLEKSLAIEEAMGARFMLGECYEKVGKLASAWINYTRVADEAHRSGQSEREAFARSRAQALRPRLSSVTLELDPAVKALAFEVWQNGERVSAALVEAPIPLDRGTHAFEIRAPGHQPFTATIDITAEGESKTLNVPALRSSGSSAEDEASVDPLLVAGLVVGGVGIVGMGISVGIAAAAKGSYDDALAQHCVELRCDPEGVDRTEAARSRGTAASVVFGVSAGAAAVGAVLAIVALASDDSEEAAWRIAPYALGLQIEGSF